MDTTLVNRRDTQSIATQPVEIGEGINPLPIARSIALGTLIAEHPRADPAGRNSRTGLPTGVFDGKADAGPVMKDPRDGQLDRRQPRESGGAYFSMFGVWILSQKDSTIGKCS
jgi:hypothetical protein